MKKKNRQLKDALKARDSQLELALERKRAYKRNYKSASQQVEGLRHKIEELLARADRGIRKLKRRSTRFHTKYKLVILRHALGRNRPKRAASESISGSEDEDEDEAKPESGLLGTGHAPRGEDSSNSGNSDRESDSGDVSSASLKLKNENSLLRSKLERTERTRSELQVQNSLLKKDVEILRLRLDVVNMKRSKPHTPVPALSGKVSSCDHWWAHFAGSIC